MGDSLPPPAAIDLVDSFARLRGAEVELVLRDPKAETAHTATALTLTKGSREVTGQVELIDDERRRLVCRLRRDELSDGIWTLMLRGVDDEPVGARLLVQGRRPLVLLWGARTVPSYVPTRRNPAGAAPAAPARRRVAARAGRSLDRVLAPLPPAQATRIRSGVRRVARRVLR